jgi:GxxExxY protein
MNKPDRDSLTEAVIGCAMKVHNKLGPGFLESIYEKALAIELARASIFHEQQKKFQVLYDGIVLGDYFADLVANQTLLLELKANQSLTLHDEVQTVHYLNATGLETGLLINFGAPRLEFKRKFRTYSNPRSDNPLP